MQSDTYNSPGSDTDRQVEVLRQNVDRWSLACGSIKRGRPASNCNTRWHPKIRDQIGAGELGDDAAWFEWEFVLEACERRSSNWNW